MFIRRRGFLYVSMSNRSWTRPRGNVKVALNKTSLQYSCSAVSSMCGIKDNNGYAKQLELLSVLLSTHVPHVNELQALNADWSFCERKAKNSLLCLFLSYKACLFRLCIINRHTGVELALNSLRMLQ